MRLHSTCPNSAVAALTQALNNGSNANDGYGTWIPLGWAIRHNAPEIAALLIDCGANVNASENGKSLVSLCLLTPGMEKMVEVLVRHGAEPNGSILRVAAKRANETIVQWGLERGVDPNNLDKHREPALNTWPAKTPVPRCLMDATFCKAIPNDAATKIVDMIARRKNLSLLTHFIQHAKVSDEVKYLLLRAVIGAKWRTGLDLMLDTHYCDPRYRSANQPSPITSCAAWISLGKHSKSGLNVLSLLLEHGYDINSTHVSGVHAFEGTTIASDAFLLIAMTKRSARPALLGFLRQHNLRPVFTGNRNTDTLAHALIRCSEWELLRDLPHHYPNIHWEQPGTSSLLSTWAKYHGAERTKGEPLEMAPEESLAIVQSLPGFDLQSRNPQGETGLRTFMQRFGGSHFYKITTLLIQAGLNPFLPDACGVSDLDYAKTLKLAPGLFENFEAQALLHHTERARGGANVVRRL